jgi:hypothetical protein
MFTIRLKATRMVALLPERSFKIYRIPGFARFAVRISPSLKKNSNNESHSLANFVGFVVGFLDV